MFNQFSLNSLAHGASNLGADLVKEQFAGTPNVEEIENFKEKILALTRIHHVEKFLFQPVEELIPDPKKYDKEDFAERRKLEEDTEKVYELAAKAYAIVKARFRPNSQAAAVIQPAEESGRLNTLWKLFLTHYDNPVTKAGAERLIRAYHEVPKNNDLINLFIHYTEHFNRIDQIQHLLTQPQQAGKRIVGLLTPKKITLSTPDTQSSATADTEPKSTFPQWARALHALHRIQHEVSKYRNLINRSLYEYIGKDTNQKLQDLTVETTLEQLKAFVSIVKDDEKPIALIAESSLFCERHGKNSSHSTQDCRALRYARERAHERHKLHENRRFENRDRSRSREGNFNNHRRDSYRSRSGSHEGNRRSRSFSRYRNYWKGKRSDSPYPGRYNRERSGSRGRFNRDRSNSRGRARSETSMNITVKQEK
jgi:hypothetical protein